MNDKTIEMRMRRRALAKGYRVEKSRGRLLHLNNKGGFQIIRIDRNEVVEGVDYDIKLKELEDLIGRLPKLRL